jgi:hypothetical protein
LPTTDFQKLGSDYPPDRLEIAVREHLKSIKREQPEGSREFPTAPAASLP